MRVLEILKGPLELIGWKFTEQTSFVSVLGSYFCLLFLLSGVIFLISIYLPVPILYQLYIQNFFYVFLIFSIASGLVIVADKYGFKNYFLLVLIVCGTLFLSFLMITQFIHDNFGSKTEIIETRLIDNRLGVNRVRIYSQMNVKAEINDIVYDYGRSDPNTKVLKENYSNPSNDVYKLTILPNSRYIIKAEKISE